jgi:6-phosphogluconolactonase (cycloisomerase 2 family)
LNLRSAIAIAALLGAGCFRHLPALGQLSNSMTAYAIDNAAGKLAKLKEYPVGRNPNWIEIVGFLQ